MISQILLTGASRNEYGETSSSHYFIKELDKNDKPEYGRRVLIYRGSVFSQYVCLYVLLILHYTGHCMSYVLVSL